MDFDKYVYFNFSTAITEKAVNMILETEAKLLNAEFYEIRKGTDLDRLTFKVKEGIDIYFILYKTKTHEKC